MLCKRTTDADFTIVASTPQSLQQSIYKEKSNPESRSWKTIYYRTLIFVLNARFTTFFLLNWHNEKISYLMADLVHSQQQVVLCFPHVSKVHT